MTKLDSPKGVLMDEIKKPLVVQSNSLVEARYRLSVEEQKLIKVLISKIQKDDESFKEYEFKIKELGETLGITHNEQYAVLKRVTERLITRGLSFYNSETKKLLQISWLSSAEYEEGKGSIVLCFDPKLKPLLLKLKSYFTKYELEQIMQLRGQYAIRFFEFRKSFLGRNKKEVVFTLKELREILGLKKTEYNQFFDFKRRILEPARSELLEKTGQSFTWEPIKQGRGGKIVSIQFFFDGDDKLNASEDITQKQKLGMSEPVTKPATSLSAELQDILSGLLAFGIAEKTARELVEKYSVDRIFEAIGLTEQQKDLQNQAGFLINAIRGDWHDPRLEKIKQQQQKRQEKNDLDARKNQLNQIKLAFSDYRIAVAREQYNAASEVERQQWKNDFLTQQPIWKNLFSGKSFDIENAMFRAFLMEKMTLPTLHDYLQKENINLTDDDWELWDHLFTHPAN